MFLLQLKSHSFHHTSNYVLLRPKPGFLTGGMAASPTSLAVVPRVRHTADIGDT